MLISLIITEALVFVKVEAAEIKEIWKWNHYTFESVLFYKPEACSIILNELVPQTLKMDSYFLISFEPPI